MIPAQIAVSLNWDARNSGLDFCSSRKYVALNVFLYRVIVLIKRGKKETGYATITHQFDDIVGWFSEIELEQFEVFSQYQY